MRLQPLTWTDTGSVAMQTSEISAWLDEVLPRHARLTDVVLALVKSLLGEYQETILEIVGRTKSKLTTIEKISLKVTPITA
jgi:hypothetical protein